MTHHLFIITITFVTLPFSKSAESNTTIEQILADNTAEIQAWTPESIVWDRTFANGSKLTVLEGPRNIPGGPFSYAFFLPDGVVVKAHWHCADARVFVAKGEMLLGQGNHTDFSETKIRRYPAGSYLIVPFKQAHFESARGDVLIFGTGSGPWCTIDTE